MSVLKCNKLSKSFGSGRTQQVVLQDVTLSFDRGERCVLLGPSGSGKTTLLSILGCLLAPSTGSVEILDRQVDFARPGDLVEIRRTRIGFIFQHAQLLPFATIEENLSIVADNLGLGRQEQRRRVSRLLEEVGLTSIRRRKPAETSGGERQRIAVARALLNSPPILLADEPTASLDWSNGERIMELLVEMSTRHQALLLIVTHEPRIMPFVDRCLHVDLGKVFEQ